MSKCMLVDFKKMNDISKPSDSKHYKGFKIFSGGAGVLRTYVRITISYKRLITDLHMMLL